MFFTIIRHSLFRDRKRKKLAVLTILFSASLITALLSLSIDVGDKMTRELKSYGANINIVPKSENIPLEIGGVDYNPLKGRVYLEQRYLADLKDIFWRNNIVGLAPFLKTAVEFKGLDRVRLIGTFFDKNLPLPDDGDYRTGAKVIFPYWQVEGAWPEEHADLEIPEVLVGAELANKLGLAVGDRFGITVPKREADGRSDSMQFWVSGILTTGGNEEGALVAPLAVVQELAGLEGEIQSVSVSALTVPEDTLSRKAHRDQDSLDSLEWDTWYCTAYVSSIAHQLEEAMPNSSARPIWQVAASEGAIIKKIQLLMAVVTLAAFISSGLGISSLMTTSIMERAGEIGLMKALGAEIWEIYLLFLSEAALVGIVGGVFGWLAGTGLAQLIGGWVFDSAIGFSPIVLPLIVFISVTIALAGSIFPSRLITGLYPAEVLHGRR